MNPSKGKMLRPKVLDAADLYDTVGMQLAIDMVAGDPEKVVMMLDQLRERMVKAGIAIGDLAPHEFDAAVGSIYYFVGVHLSEGWEDVRCAVEQHMATCKDHSGHKLMIKFLKDGVESVVESTAPPPPASNVTN